MQSGNSVSSPKVQLSVDALRAVSADLKQIISDDEEDEKRASISVSNGSFGDLEVEPKMTHAVTFFGSIISDDGDQSATNIKELVMKVTDGEDIHSIPHKKVELVLLLCHKAFTDSETMLTVLLDRVSDPDLSEIQIRIRGVSMCQHWIQNYWNNDFVEQEEMLNIMDKFVDGMDDLDLPAATIRILGRIKKTYEDRVC